MSRLDKISSSDRNGSQAVAHKVNQSLGLSKFIEANMNDESDDSVDIEFENHRDGIPMRLEQHSDAVSSQSSVSKALDVLKKYASPTPSDDQTSS